MLPGGIHKVTERELVTSFMFKYERTKLFDSVPVHKAESEIL